MTAGVEQIYLPKTFKSLLKIKIKVRLSKIYFVISFLLFCSITLPSLSPTVAQKAEDIPLSENKEWVNSASSPLQPTKQPLTKTQLNNFSDIQAVEVKPQIPITDSLFMLPSQKLEKSQKIPEIMRNITSLKLQEESEEALFSSDVLFNSTFCNVCTRFQAWRTIVMEYNGSVVSQTFEATPYFYYHPNETLIEWHHNLPISVHQQRGGQIQNGSELVEYFDDWTGRTFSFTQAYGHTLGDYQVIFYVKAWDGISGSEIKVEFFIPVLITYHFPRHYAIVYTIIVRDTTKPVLHNYYEDVDFEYGNEHDLVFNWVASDLLPDKFTIKRNGVIVEEKPFVSNQTVQYSISHEELALGINDFEITFYDTSGNKVSDSVKVGLHDRIDPVFHSRQEDFHFAYQIPGYFALQWVASDVLPDSYVITQDGIVIAENSFQSNQSTWYFGKTEELDYGVHEFRITYSDTSGNTASDSMMVTVFDSIAPTLDELHHGTHTYEYGEAPLSFSWNASDQLPSFYEISKDGTTLVNEVWNNSMPIEFTTDDDLPGTHQYLLIVYDYAGNFISDDFTVVIRDTTKPVFTKAPESKEISLYPIQLIWEAFDFFPSTYSIVRNGTYLAWNLPWELNTPIQQTHQFLTLETIYYEFTIILSDQFGNTESHVVLIGIEDRTSPVITNSGDKVFELGFDLDEITWELFDAAPHIYSITVDQIPVALHTGVAWTPNQTITFALPFSSIGTYSIKITANDTSNRVASLETSIIIQDTIPPVYDSPGNRQYYLGATENSLSWRPADLSAPGMYAFYASAQLNKTGAWNSEDELIFNVDGLEVGTYNYTIVFRDFYGNSIQDTSFVTVLDLFPPELEPVESLTLEYGTLGQSISWYPVDSDPSYYTLLKDGVTVLQSQAWSSGEKIGISLNNLPVGTITYKVIFNDFSGRSVSDEVTITVIDTISPQITPEFATTVESDEIHTDQNLYLNWVLIDLNPAIYNITINGTLLDSSAWQTGDEVIYFLSETNVGIYNYTITAIDVYGNGASQSVSVNVQDTISPVLTDLGDRTYDFGNYNYTFSWSVDDGQPAGYNITRNGTLLDEGTWGSKQVIELDFLQPEMGDYHFTLNIWDKSGNYANDSFMVKIIDADIPIISALNSQVLELWTNKTLYWAVRDSSGKGTFEIYKNNQLLTMGIWISGALMELRIQANETGTDVFEFFVRDPSGKLVTERISVTVFVPTEQSHLPGLADRVLEFGVLGETLVWMPQKFNNGKYNITLNGQLIATSSYWLSKDYISISLDGLPIGTYIYNLTILDFSNTGATDRVTITVKDTIRPQLVSPTELQFSALNSLRFFHWEATDVHPGKFWFSNSSGILETGSWMNGERTILWFDNLEVGNYNFTLLVSDQFNNNQSQLIQVLIYNTQSPIIGTTFDQTHEFGNQSRFFTWFVADDNPDYFQIFKNDTLVKTGSWQSNEAIFVNLTNLATGVYKYEIRLYDSSQNFTNDTVYVKIEDTIQPTVAPTLGSAQNLQIPVAQTGHSLTWVASDLQPDNYTLWENGTILHTGLWGAGEAITFPLTLTSIGIFNFTLQVTDKALNTASSQVFVQAIDTLAPRISVINSLLTIEFGSTGNELIWDVIETSTWNYTITRDSKILAEGQTEGNRILQENIDGLNRSIYLYKLSIIDSEGNIASKYIEVQVVDTIKPVISEKAETVLLNYTEAYYILSWNVSDLLPSTFKIFKDGIMLEEGNWEDAEVINYTFSNLIPGHYNFTILVSDTSDNFETSPIFLTIEDKLSPTITFVGQTHYEVSDGVYSLNWEVFDDFSGEFAIIENLYLTSDTIASVNLTAIELQYGQPSNSTNGITSLDELFDYLLKIDSAILTSGTSYEQEISVSQIFDGTINNKPFTIVVYDQSRNFNYDSRAISVVDTGKPIFKEMPNLMTNISDEVELFWSAFDYTPATYSIKINEVVVETDSWDSEQNFTIPVSNLARGYYTILIEISDKSENRGSYQFYLNKTFDENVVTQPVVPKIFVSEYRINYEMGDKNNSVFRLHKPLKFEQLTYELYVNGSVIRASKVWPEELILDIYLDDLQRGIYNLTLLAQDGAGNQYRNMTLITVQDTISPTIKIDYKADTIVSTSKSVSVIIKLHDINPGNYAVHLNNIFTASGTWKNGEVLVINFDNLAIGNYTLLITGFDATENFVTKSLKLVVLFEENITRSQSTITSTTSVGFLETNVIIYWWLILVAGAISAVVAIATKMVKRKKQ